MTLSITFYNMFKYGKDDFLNRDRDFFGNGIVNETDFPLTVPTTSAMTLQIGAGVAWVDGYRIANDDTLIALTFQPADAQPRMDIVQVGHDDIHQCAAISVKQGTAAASPTEPDPDSGYVKLYAVTIPANALAITSDNVGDRRNLVPLNISGSQIRYVGTSSTGANTYSGVQTAPSFVATSQTAPWQLPNLSALPAQIGPAGTVCLVNGKWWVSDGAQWSSTAPALQPATATVLGGVKVGSNLSIDANGTLSASAPFVLQPATNATLGGIKVGTNLSITADGTLSGAAPYTLPVATGSTLGGVMQGSGVTIASNGTISASPSSIGAPALQNTVSDVKIAATSATSVLSYTPSISGNFVVFLYYRVVTAATAITLQVTYNDWSGAQTNTLLNNQTSAVGSYSLVPLYLNAVSGQPITVSVTAGTANQVYVSATIMGV